MTVRCTIVVVALAFLGMAPPTRAQSLRVDRGDLERTLIEAGELRAVRTRELAAPGDGRFQPRIVQLRAEGSSVAEGDTLVRFDTTTLREQVRQAEAELERQRAAYTAKRVAQEQGRARLQSQIRTAEFAAEQARLRLTRMEFAAEIERQSAQLSLRQAELSLAEARTKSQAQAVLDSLELAQLQTGIDQARSDVELERAQIDRMVITAPMAGIVLHGDSGDDDRKVREGDEVQPGLVIVRLPDLSELEVTASVHELDRAHVDVGQPVRVGFDAYPDLVLEGRVARVAELAGPARRRSRIQRFELRIEVEGTDARLRPGMTARVEIVTARRENVLRVPRAALATRPQAPHAPVVITDAGNVVEVRVGLLTPLFVELIEGPPEGTVLRRPDPATFASFALPSDADVQP